MYTYSCIIDITIVFVLLFKAVVPGLGQIGECVVKKNEGPHLKKIVRKSRNSCTLNSGGVGAHGQLTRDLNGLSPDTNTNAQRILFVLRLLRSPWYPSVSNCWSSPHSF